MCPSSGFKWTPFYDRDDPSGSGDHETLTELRKNNSICVNPVSIDARVKVFFLPDFRSAKQRVDVSPSLGLRCLNRKNKRKCRDYTVRFCCGEFCLHQLFVEIRTQGRLISNSGFIKYCSSRCMPRHWTCLELWQYYRDVCIFWKLILQVIFAVGVRLKLSVQQ